MDFFRQGPPFADEFGFYWPAREQDSWFLIICYSTHAHTDIAKTHTGIASQI